METKTLRLQKYLAQKGIASRREAEKWISEGRISINGEITTQLGVKVDPDTDAISVDGKLIQIKEPPKVYWLLHKPDKVLTSRPTGDGRPTIYDLPSLRKVKFLVAPVGRLDFRTEGLLLLSNDGDLVYRLTHPKFKMPRLYHVLSDKALTAEQERQLTKGIQLEDGPVKGVKIQRLGGHTQGKSGFWYLVTVFEGRNRLVRRLFEHFDLEVKRLVRTGFGDLVLPDSLKPGEYIQLAASDIQALKKATQLPQ